MSLKNEEVLRMFLAHYGILEIYREVVDTSIQEGSTITRFSLPILQAIGYFSKNLRNKEIYTIALINYRWINMVIDFQIKGNIIPKNV